MRTFRVLRTALVGAIVMAVPISLYAQPQGQPPSPADAQALRAEIAQLKSDFEARMSALEARLATLGGTAAAVGDPAASPATAPPAPPATAEVPAGAAGAGDQSGALPVYGNASAGSKVFNPDIAVIGNFLGAAGKNDVNPSPALEMPESELSLQAVVDPYARADFFMAFGEQGVDLEEGFLTFPAIPGGFLLKVGKQRAAFGKVNTLHSHVLPWTDRPLVTENLVGGEEGIADAGFSVARLIPNPWIFLEATGQVFRGDSGDLFHSSQRGDLSYVGHLRGYHDLTESTNVDLGLSYARGHNASGVAGDIDLGRFTTDLFGVDATVRWRPLQRSIYHSFIGRSEVIWSKRQQPALSAVDGPLGRQDATGFYVSADYQFARRWYTGVRVDRSDRADEAARRDSGASWSLTYWPSEFSQVRGQYRHTKYAEDVNANEFLFQFQFAIGAHGAHPF